MTRRKSTELARAPHTRPDVSMAESDCMLTATVVDIDASIVAGYGVIRGRYMVRASAVSRDAAL